MFRIILARLRRETHRGGAPERHFLGFKDMGSGWLSEFERGIRAGVPMMLGYIPIALILGVTASQVGLAPLEAGFLAGANYAGGSEFAALSLWSAVPPVFAIAVTTWLVNSRHIMLGAALTPYIAHLPLAKALGCLYIMTDESWAIEMADIFERRKAGAAAEALFSVPFYLGVSVLLWVSWWASAVIGCTASGMIGDLSSWGIRAAFPALFITLVAMMWPGAKKCLPVAASAAASAGLSLVLSLPAAILAGIVIGLAAAYFSEAADA